MITDRCSTAGLLHVLSFEYNEYVTFPLFRVLFMGLILLDISSHWCQVCCPFLPILILATQVLDFMTLQRLFRDIS